MNSDKAKGLAILLGVGAVVYVAYEAYQAGKTIGQWISDALGGALAPVKAVVNAQSAQLQPSYDAASYLSSGAANSSGTEAEQEADNIAGSLNVGMSAGG